MGEKALLNPKSISVGFWGKYIPLQGVQYIIKAADLLRDVPTHFYLVGSGQTYKMAKDLAGDLSLDNVTFLKKIHHTRIPTLVESFDIVLGIFGDTKKMSRVIPNKIYEASAMGKPIITGDSSAIRELFTHKQNIILCKTADPVHLADSILFLAKDERLRARIGDGARELYLKTSTPYCIGKKLLKDLQIKY